MPDDSVLNIKITADISSLTSGFTQAAGSAEDFNARMKAALADLEAATKDGAAAQEVFNKSFEEAQLAGASYLQSLEAGGRAYKQYAQSVREAATANSSQGSPTDQAGEISATAAAYRRLAAATLEAAEARKIFSAAVKSYAGSQDEQGIVVVAAVQEQAIAAAEQLALAKANLAEVQEAVAKSAQLEAEAVAAGAGSEDAAAAGAAAVSGALTKLTAQALAARQALATVAGTGALEDDAGEISDLTAAYSQLAEATLEAVDAKQALNTVLKENAGRIDAAAIAETIAAQRRATEATEQLTLAKRNLAEVEEYVATAAAQETTAVGEAAVAEATLGTATRETAVGMRASAADANLANNEVRTFAGNMYGAERTAASFLATTLGLGPVLRAAFPIIGALALIEVLVDVAENIHQVYEQASEAGQAISRAFDDASDSVQKTTDEIELQNSKLQDEIDKISGHPNDGLRTALEEDIVAADKLQDALDGVFKKMDSIFNNPKFQVGLGGAFLTGVAPTKDLSEENRKIIDDASQATQETKRQYEDFLRDAGKDQQAIIAATSAYHQQIQKIIDDANAKLQPALDENRRMQQESANLLGEDPSKASTLNRVLTRTGGLMAGAPSAGVDHSAAIADSEKAQDLLNQIQEQAEAIEVQEPLEQKKGKAQQAKENAEAAKQAEEQHLHDLETAFAQEELLYGKSANQTAAYWSQYLNDTRLGADQLREVYEKVVAARAELGKKQPESEVDKALKKQVTEAKKDAKEYQEALDDMMKARTELFKSLEQEPMEAQAKQGHAVALNSIEEAHTQAQIPYQSGAEQDPTKQLAEVRAYHEAVLSENERFVLEQVAQLEAANPQQVDAMEKLQQDLTDAEKTGNEHRIELAQEALNQEITAMTQVGGEQAKQLEELQNKLTEIEHDGNMKRLQDTEQKLQQQLQKYKQVYDLMTNDFNHAFEQWATKEQTAAQAFSKMLMSMETGIEQLVLQELEKKLFPALMKLLHIDDGSNSASQANQQALTTDRTVNPQIVESNSAAAASLVFLTSGGDVAAAAETYAEGMMYFPLAAFEHGGIVSGINNMPVPIVAHAGERVLTQFQNRNLETLANQSQAGRGNTNHLHYNPTIHALDKNNFERAFRNQKDTLFDMMRGWRP